MHGAGVGGSAEPSELLGGTTPPQLPPPQQQRLSLHLDSNPGQKHPPILKVGVPEPQGLHQSRGMGLPQPGDSQAGASTHPGNEDQGRDDRPCPPVSPVFQQVGSETDAKRLWGPMADTFQKPRG